MLRSGGASCRAAASTASSTAVLTRTTGGAPLRSTVRLAWIEPRARDSAARDADRHLNCVPARRQPQTQIEALAVD